MKLKEKQPNLKIRAEVHSELEENTFNITTDLNIEVISPNIEKLKSLEKNYKKELVSLKNKTKLSPAKSDVKQSATCRPRFVSSARKLM